VKKIIILMVFFSIILFGCGFTESSNKIAQNASEINSKNAQIDIPIPVLSYFQERKTINKWARYWDKPNLPTYVYLWVFDKCIGYYVADGKPASTKSYLTPEYKQEYYSNGGVIESQLADIDGTYGDNNPGIRFFTASGIPVEHGGAGASYTYSAYPIPILSTTLLEIIE
jgi:hypothetical protein